MASTQVKTTPTFMVYVNNSRLALEKEGDIQEITVIEKIDAPSSFSVIVSDIKDMDKQTENKRKWADWGDIAPGSEVKISLGYVDDVEEVMNGEVTALSPMFSTTGGDRLIIKGHNFLHRLVRAKKTRSFTGDIKDSDIIKQMADEAGLSSDIDDIGIKHLFTMQRNQTDYDYLMDMAVKYNCKVWAKEKKLFFKKLQENSGEDVIVEWGKTVIDFNAYLDTSKLITEVEVRGWDPEKSEAVVGSKTVSDITLKIGGNKFGGSIVQEKFGDAKMIYIDENVIDKNGADQLALDIITENSMNYITGSGKIQGDYNIKAGTIIKINEIGEKFSDKYYVTSVKHVFNLNQGYITYFEVARNATK